MRRPGLAILTMFGCSPHEAAPATKAEVAEIASPPSSPAPSIAPREPLPPKQPSVATTWTTLAVAPDCEVKVADTPAGLGPPLTWGQCKDKSEGCLEVQTVVGDAIGPNVSIQGLARGGQTTVAVITSMPGPLARYVLASRDGLPFFAVEGPQVAQCSLGRVGLSDDGAVIEVTFDNKGGYASRAYLRGPLAEDPAWRAVAAVLPRRKFPQFIGESVLSVGGRVMVEQNGGPLRWYDDAAQRWVEVPGSHDGWECCASGHGDAVVFSYSMIPERAMAARIGERAHPLRRGQVDGMSPVMIDGGQAVWLEGRSRDNNNYYKRVELWTAEVAEGPVLTNARQVMRLPRTTMATPSFGGGVVAVPVGDREDGFLVVRLAGEEQRSLKPPAGLMIEQLLWISGDEVAVRLGPGELVAEPPAVRRIALASLPPWPAK